MIKKIAYIGMGIGVIVFIWSVYDTREQYQALIPPETMNPLQISSQWLLGLVIFALSYYFLSVYNIKQTEKLKNAKLATKADAGNAKTAFMYGKSKPGSTREEFAKFQEKIKEFEAKQKPK